jgi:hypothetical protein
MRRVAAIVVVLLAVMLPSIHASADAWVRPVAGRVVRPFDPPTTRYGPGHVGVDFAATPGTPVRAAGAGTVEFAGAVGRSLHVVIAHDGTDLRTTYSFLATIRVRVRGRVEAGAVLGTTGGTGDGHDGTVLHFGLRRDDTYLDPMQLFGPPDLAGRVHLAPVREAPRPLVLAPCGGWVDGACRWARARELRETPRLSEGLGRYNAGDSRTDPGVMKHTSARP